MIYSVDMWSIYRGVESTYLTDNNSDNLPVITRTVSKILHNGEAFPLVVYYRHLFLY